MKRGCGCVRVCDTDHLSNHSRPSLVISAHPQPSLAFRIEFPKICGHTDVHTEKNVTPKDPLRINARDLKISNIEKIGSFWAEWPVPDLIMNRCIKLRVKFDFQPNTTDFSSFLVNFLGTVTSASHQSFGKRTLIIQKRSCYQSME